MGRRLSRRNGPLFLSVGDETLLVLGSATAESRVQAQICPNTRTL